MSKVTDQEQTTTTRIQQISCSDIILSKISFTGETQNWDHSLKKYVGKNFIEILYNNKPFEILFENKKIKQLIPQYEFGTQIFSCYKVSMMLTRREQDVLEDIQTKINECLKSFIPKYPQSFNKTIKTKIQMDENHVKTQLFEGRKNNSTFVFFSSFFEPQFDISSFSTAHTYTVGIKFNLMYILDCLGDKGLIVSLKSVVRTFEKGELVQIKKVTETTNNEKIHSVSQPSAFKFS